MIFSITPSLTDKVFQKVGKLAKADINLESNGSDVQFCRGFIDSLQKEAKVSEDIALGIIEFFCEKGANWLSENNIMPKEAADEEVSSSIGRAKDRLVQGLFDKLKPVIEPHVRSDVNDMIKHNFQSAVSGAKQFGGKAWEYLKSPQFLNEVAPMLAGGLIGGLAPKAFGGGTIPTVLGATGGALLGRQIAANKDDIYNTGKDYIDTLRKQVSETFKSNPVNR